MAESRQSRRGFLATLALLPTALILAWRYLVPGREQGRPTLTIDRREVPANGALVFRESRVAVLRDAGGYHALNLACPHLGCTVTVTAGEIVCPCHGSRFDRQGKLLEGPADRNLGRLPVEMQGDRLVVSL